MKMNKTRLLEKYLFSRAFPQMNAAQYSKLLREFLVKS